MAGAEGSCIGTRGHNPKTVFRWASLWGALRDEQWALVGPSVRGRKKGGLGRPWAVERRRILNAVFSILHTVCETKNRKSRKVPIHDRLLPVLQALTVKGRLWVFTEPPSKK